MRNNRVDDGNEYYELFRIITALRYDNEFQ